MLLLSLLSIATPPQATGGQPNFVILFADDWGWGDLGANFKAAAGMTPNLDKIASEGVRFTDFHVGASVCSVSRAALLTARLGVRNGVVTNFHVDSEFGLPRTENTIAELLKPAGYATAAIGKWHLGTTPGFHPTYRGFDHYVGLPYSVDMGCTDTGGFDRGTNRKCGGGKDPPTDKQFKLPLPLYRSTTNCSGQTTGSCNGVIAEQPVNFTALSDTYADFAEEFIGNHTTDPFFLYVPFSHIHTPQYVAVRNSGKSGKTGDAGHFYDALLELDETVGKIMASLKRHGVDDNTLVFVTGDNGPWETKCALTGSAGPYVGGWQRTIGGGGSASKTTLWEGGHREVGLARWPGKIAPGRVSGATLSSMDYLPTMLALAKVALPSDRVYDGIDISSVLFAPKSDDDASAAGAHTTLFHPNSGAQGGIMGKLDAVRWNDPATGKQWKAIYQTGGAPDCEGKLGDITRHDPPLLFELGADPGETTALDVTVPANAAALTSIVAALAAQMHSVNTTFQSVVNVTSGLLYEPCAHYPVSCRSDGGPTPGPTPPPGPPGPTPPPGSGKCTFQNNTGFAKGQQVPGHRNDPAATEQACCDLCAAIQGCSGASYTSGQCYYKTKAEMKSHPLKDVTAVFGSWAPQPPAPPAPKCSTFKTAATCAAAKGETCVWDAKTSTCNAPAKPTPPPTMPPPPPPPPPALPPTPVSPACPSGVKPVQVFVMMGQSNMLGEGRKTGTTSGSLQYAVETEHKYPYLWDATNKNYSTSKNVRNVFVMGSGGMTSAITLQHNEFMTAATTTPATQPGMSSRAKNSVGPELGIGFALGQAKPDESIMTLKTCIGDRALGWDLLPPTTKRSTFVQENPKTKVNETWIYAGYHDTPSKWLNGTVPVPKPWNAGIQYDGDVNRSGRVLGNLASFYPDRKCFEVAGFFWWQGDRDSRDMGLSTHYEANLVTLIEQLRLQYHAPNAPFVTASLGQTVLGSTSGDGLILDAMLNVGCNGAGAGGGATAKCKYPQFKNNVAAVYTHPLEHTSGSSGAHYGKDAETYMNVGEAMGAAMVKMLK